MNQTHIHCTHVTPHDVPNLNNRQLLPQPSDIGLQRETLRINKVNGLVETGIENLSTRPNHLYLGDKNSEAQTKREIRECEVGAVRKIHLSQENSITLQR